jgi:hypothetical protein
MVPPSLALRGPARAGAPAVEATSRSQLPTTLRRFQSADDRHRSTTPERRALAEATPVP